MSDFKIALPFFGLAALSFLAFPVRGQDAPAFSRSVWEVEQHDQMCPFMTLRVVNGCGDRDRMETVDTPHGQIRLGYDMRGGCFRDQGLPDIAKVIAMPEGVWTWPDQRRFELLEDGRMLEVQFCVDVPLM